MHDLYGLAYHPASLLLGAGALLIAAALGGAAALLWAMHEERVERRRAEVDTHQATLTVLAESVRALHELARASQARPPPLPASLYRTARLAIADDRTRVVGSRCPTPLEVEEATVDMIALTTDVLPDADRTLPSAEAWPPLQAWLVRPDGS